MKNVRFFSNKIVLVAIVVISSIMMMSFKSTSTKKELAYSVKVEKGRHANVQGVSSAKTVDLIFNLVETVHEVTGFMDNFVSVCYTENFLKVRESDQAAKDKKMSKF